MTLAIHEAAQAELARRERLSVTKAAAEDDLIEFIKMMWHAVEPETPFVPGWPLEAMADALMAVADGNFNRLLVNIFPGAMKSLMLNVFFVAWCWGPKGDAAPAVYQRKLQQRPHHER